MRAARVFRNRMWMGILLAILMLAIIRVPVKSEHAKIIGEGQLRDLPLDLLFSWLRMWAAYIASIVFAIFIGTLAATNDRRAKILLPLIDILQSIPIFGFFPTAIYWFVKAGGQLFGVEAAVIFLIFTSQSWNLVFAVYDGIKAVPTESLEAARSMGLSDLAIFRRIFIPASFPRIIDNSVISWANGWYFLMACEIIALGPTSYKVAGIGSFLQGTIDAGRWSYVAIGIGSLVALIIFMDVLIWKPLRALSLQFKFESNKQNEDSTRVSTGDRLLNLYRNSIFFSPLRKVISTFHAAWVAIERFFQPPSQEGFKESVTWKWGSSSSLAIFWTALVGLIVFSLFVLGKSLFPPWQISPSRILLSILVSSLRILAAYILSLLWILPLVYWVHTRPFPMRVLQSSAQILASVPATAFFPLITLAVLKVFGVLEFSVLLLLMTGMQWYLLFNVLGGANSLPNDIREVSASLGVGRWLYIKRVFLPSIVPALVTGSITAVGGGWNALVISEYSQSKAAPYSVFGIGSVINIATYENGGDEKLLSLSLLLLVTVIVLVNRFMWQPLFKTAEKKYRLEG